MKVAVYSSHKFERNYLLEANEGKHELTFIDVPLSKETAMMAVNHNAISVFVSDDVSQENLIALKNLGINYVALRSAGYNHVDLETLKSLEMRAARVPAYSPYAVAEHAVALMLALNRKLIRSNSRINELNFSLDGLVGFDMQGKTVGIIGTGKIGSVVAKIMFGFGCRLIAFDDAENKELKDKYEVEYMKCEELCKQADIITLHVPLMESTRYLINKQCISQMKKNVMLINTSRGTLVNTKDVIDALKTGQVGYFGMDVYEEEKHLFFEDHSEDILQDEIIGRLMTFKNVLITGHQAFLTKEALQNIASTTIYNLDCFEKKAPCENEIKTKI